MKAVVRIFLFAPALHSKAQIRPAATSMMVIQASSILWMSLVAQSGMLVQVATIDQQRTPRRTSQISICVLVQDFVMPSNVLRSLCPWLRLAAQVQEGGQQLPCGRGPRGDVELDVAPTPLLYVNTSLYIGSSSSSSSSVFSVGFDCTCTSVHVQAVQLVCVLSSTAGHELFHTTNSMMHDH
jgi:hypothetical protein